MGWPRAVPAQPNPYWTQLAEQRLNQISRELRDVKEEFGKLRDKQGQAERNSADNGYGIKRLEERLAEVGAMLVRIENMIPDKARATLVERVVFGLVALILVAVIGLWLKTIGIGR